jgi:glycosyltransferase involved in cell wall biosynthesis
LQGILQFIETALPAIRAEVPSVQLLVLGGEDAVDTASQFEAFAQPGIEVSGHRDDVPAVLGQSAMTINPLSAIRGSAIKLIESLTEGRVCISTADGARGFTDNGFPGLIVVRDVEAMVEPIIRLLKDSAARHQLEVPVPDKLAPYQWAQCARVQKNLYEELICALKAPA